MAIATRPKPKVPQKKRQARHHRQSRHYLKAYWPYLPMLLIVVVGLAINSLWTATAVLGSKSDFSANTLLSETNSRRAAEQQSPLTLDSQLSAAAQAKANDMVAADYWSHTSPAGQTPWSFITASGYQYQLAGENLAFGFDSATSTISGWMNSPTHRDNLLNSDYQNVGFGVARSPDFQGKGPATIIVAEYAKPVEAAANITFTVPETAANSVAQANDVRGANSELPAQSVSRIDVLTGGNLAWITVAASALVGAALALLITRHSIRLHRTLRRGEAFVTHHPILDIGIVLLITVGFVLTRTTGIII